MQSTTIQTAAVSADPRCRGQGTCAHLCTLLIMIQSVVGRALELECPRHKLALKQSKVQTPSYARLGHSGSHQYRSSWMRTDLDGTLWWLYSVRTSVAVHDHTKWRVVFNVYQHECSSYLGSSSLECIGCSTAADVSSASLKVIYPATINEISPLDRPNPSLPSPPILSLLQMPIHLNLAMLKQC
jgi:hypothetical protein